MPDADKIPVRATRKGTVQGWRGTVILPLLNMKGNWTQWLGTDKGMNSSKRSHIMDAIQQYVGMIHECDPKSRDLDWVQLLYLPQSWASLYYPQTMSLTCKMGISVTSFKGIIFGGTVIIKIDLQSPYHRSSYRRAQLLFGSAGHYLH